MAPLVRGMWASPSFERATCGVVEIIDEFWPGHWYIDWCAGPSTIETKETLAVHGARVERTGGEGRMPRQAEERAALRSPPKPYGL
jgi:hypothetical protein